MSERRSFFPWVCRETGALFFVEGVDPVEECPICKDTLDLTAQDAFDTGHCYRKYSEGLCNDEPSESRKLESAKEFKEWKSNVLGI